MLESTININHVSIKNGDKYIFNVMLNSSLPYIKPTIFVASLDISGSMSGQCSDTTDTEISKFSSLI